VGTLAIRLPQATRRSPSRNFDPKAFSAEDVSKLLRKVACGKLPEG